MPHLLCRYDAGFEAVFVLAVESKSGGIDGFQVVGNLGADGGGIQADGKLSGPKGTTAYYKATYGASAPGVSLADPSVNHLVFAPGADGAKASCPPPPPPPPPEPAFRTAATLSPWRAAYLPSPSRLSRAQVTLSETTDDDLHEVIFPQGLSLVYYVLWAGKEGYHYKREAFQTASRHHCARTPRAPPPRVRSAAPPPHPPLHLSTSSVRYLCTSAGARPPRRVVRAPRLHAAARPRRRGRRRRRHRHPHHHVRPAPPHHHNPRAVRMVLPPPFRRSCVLVGLTVLYMVLGSFMGWPVANKMKDGTLDGMAGCFRMPLSVPTERAPGLEPHPQPRHNWPRATTGEGGAGRGPRPEPWRRGRALASTQAGRPLQEERHGLLRLAQHHLAHAAALRWQRPRGAGQRHAVPGAAAVAAAALSAPRPPRERAPVPSLPWRDEPTIFTSARCCRLICALKTKLP